MEELKVVITVIGSIVGVLIGAFLQHQYSKKLEAKKQLQSLRTAAYVDFIRSVAENAMAYKYNKPDDIYKSLIGISDARARIAIYGGSSVASAVAAFLRNGASVETEIDKKLITDAIQRMRLENCPEEMIPRKDISQLIVGEDAED